MPLINPQCSSGQQLQYMVRSLTLLSHEQDTHEPLILDMTPKTQPPIVQAAPISPSRVCLTCPCPRSRAPAVPPACQRMCASHPSDQSGACGSPARRRTKWSQVQEDQAKTYRRNMREGAGEQYPHSWLGCARLCKLGKTAPWRAWVNPTS